MIRKTAGYFALAGVVVALVGCSGKGEDSGTDNSCTISIAETYPAADATNAYYRTTIEITFTAADTSATMSVDGGVTGATEWRGNTLVLTPDSPLAPSTSYTVNISYCDGEKNPSITFKTSEVGGSTDSGGLVDNAYLLDLASARFVYPEGVGPLLQQYLTVDILMGITSADASNIQFEGAIGVENAEPPVQDTCQPTIPFPEADFSDNPYFEVGPATTTISVSDFDVTITDLFISGAVSPSGDYIDGAVLAGAVDTRPLVPLLDEEGADDAICELAESIGVSCETCPDGSGDFCLSLYVDSISAPGLDSSVEVIADPCLRTECADDPDCQ